MLRCLILLIPFPPQISVDNDTHTKMSIAEFSYTQFRKSVSCWLIEVPNADFISIETRLNELRCGTHSILTRYRAKCCVCGLTFFPPPVFFFFFFFTPIVLRRLDSDKHRIHTRSLDTLTVFKKGKKEEPKKPHPNRHNINAGEFVW